jgi:hypothetical protein
MADKITDGLKHDGGKPRLDLVPPEIIEAVGAVMTHGAEKYGEASYRDVEPKRYRAALMRHICKWLKDPHGVDDDSGLPHLWHIACNVAFLLELDKPERVEHKSETHFNQCDKNSLKLKRVTTNNEMWFVVDTKWVCVKSGENKTWVCPKCDTLGNPQWVCCPVCGMKMRGEEE